MFSTKEQLEKRTGEFGVGRLEFLTQIVHELKKTESEECKEQVLANLANFAYDPINYDFLRKLKVIDIFLDHLSDNNIKLQEFAVAGICNLCLDPENKEYILHQQGVSHLSPLLLSTNEEIVINTLATLGYLITPQSKSDITSPEIIQHAQQLTENSSKRISNLAKVFLSDYACI